MLKFDEWVVARGSFQLTTDIKLPQGKWLAVVGPSGAGKTSLLMGLAGFIKPASGCIFWNDRDITYMKPADRPITYLFQNHNVFEHLTVWQNVALGIHPSSRLSKEQKERVYQALVRVRLTDKENNYPTQLSGGEQQRVAIARSVVRQRPLLLLDEPFTALDPSLRREMADLIKELRASWPVTTLMVTHAPLEIRDHAHHVLFVYRGSIKFFDTFDAFIDSSDENIKSYLK